MPDRLPSLIVLVGFWVPPAIAGRMAASSLQRWLKRDRPALLYLAATGFVLAYAAAWFLWNVNRMPPYIPGASMDPTFPSPESFIALLLFTAAVIAPGSAIAFAVAYYRRRRQSVV